MSGTPNKRSHEEAGGHSSASKYPHDDSVIYPNVGAKLISSSTNEYHPSFDMAQDSRLPKIPRTESRDADRRSPLLPMYRMPSYMSDSHSDHPVTSENRPELRDPKDINKDFKIESRDLYQGAKGEKDIRFENKGDDNSKDMKYDYPDYKGEMKTDTNLTWKDYKEQHRGKRYPDTPGGNVDSWHTSRANVHGVGEVGKEGLTAEERDYTETHEAVGENKVDVKGEDKLKDKDRKRKDGKHREWGDRDKERSDRRSNLQIGSGSNDGKESVREERESEKWERERKDALKEKDKQKEREKHHMKREAWNSGEKEGLHNEKEAMDVSGRAMEPENSTIEQKKQKDHDNWKNVERDGKDKRKERETDVEGERVEKHNRYNDKESDDGCLDAEGGTERDRELFSYGVQQRKRMLRPRVSPQVGNREPRFRSRTQDNEGPQGKPDISTIVYRVGECMQELIKSWKEYESSQADKICESSQNGPTLEIRIPAEHVTATNRQVRGGQLWGTDVYTDDSDLVAVLMHTGYCCPTASPPPPAIQELRATIRVLPPQECYISTLRNNVRSRAWGAAIGCSYRVERCCIVKKGGGTIDLEPCLTHTSTVEPTLAPVVVERTMTTRAAASNALRQQRFVREVTIQYNLCNEPWIKYSISAVADKGLKKPLYTSARLKKGEVLYLESHACRYELCFTGEKMVKSTSHAHEMETEKLQTHVLHSTNGERSAMDGDSVMIDVFRWSRCKKPLPQIYMRSIGIPLALEHLEVLEENLDWEDIQWSQTGVWIAGKEFPLARVHFLSLA